MRESGLPGAHVSNLRREDRRLGGVRARETLRDALKDALRTAGRVPETHAIVYLNELCKETGLYVVITTKEEVDLASFARNLKKTIEVTSASTKVDWVRPLSVRFQRLFGWGDVTASKTDIDEACKNDDKDELKVIVPGCAPLLDLDPDSYLPVMPQLAEALRGELLPAPHSALLRAVHEVQESHDWEHAKKAECTICDDTICDEIPAYVCACGAQRCERHRAKKVEVDAPDYTWSQRDDSAAPFYVVDLKKISSVEKLEWIRQELGCAADLVDFATTFLKLFGAKIRSAPVQKKAVFELYALYSGDAKLSPTKESDLPPAERASFQRVWDKNAPNLCEHCGKALRKGVKDFCSTECRFAGRIVTCRFCGIEVKNFYCPSCKRGVDVKGPMTEQRSLTLRAQELFRTDATASSSDYEPAWMKQRRS